MQKRQNAQNLKPPVPICQYDFRNIGKKHVPPLVNNSCSYYRAPTVRWGRPILALPALRKSPAQQPGLQIYSALFQKQQKWSYQEQQ